MRALLSHLLLCLLAFSPFLPRAESAPADGAESIVETVAGKRYVGCSDFRVQGDTLAFLHSGGRSMVRVAEIARMPEAARRILGLREESRVVAAIEQSELLVRFLAAYEEAEAVAAEIRRLEAEKPDRIRFKVLDQIDPRSVGIAPEHPAGELYRVQIHEGAEPGPSALLETMGEKVFTTSLQTLPVRYVRKVNLQRSGLAASIEPLFREAADLSDARAAELLAKRDALRATLRQAALRVHPGVACADCAGGRCAACEGKRRLACASCRGTRFSAPVARTEACKACRGKGSFERISGSAPCRTCRGSGQVAAGSTSDPCGACAGAGAIPCARCTATGRCASCAGQGRKPPGELTDEQLQALYERGRRAVPAP